MSEGNKLQVISTKGKSMTQVLAENLNSVVVNRDDLQCKGILGSMGMLDLFQKPKEPYWSMVASDDHSTHFVVGMRFAGNPKPEDNGYVVYFVPKNGIMLKLQDVVDFVVEMQGGYDGNNPVVVKSESGMKSN